MGNFCCGYTSHTARKGDTVPKVDYAFFDSLPSGVQEATIDRVYDGDTLTIDAQKHTRVRLLGIDAPELKEKEPYAKEAADFLKSTCKPGSKIWLHSQMGDKTDRYKRLLAFVFVANPTGKPGFICVNISLLQQGLATFYEPGGRAEYKENMIKAQEMAISERRSIWKKVNMQKRVYTTPNGIAFHNADCVTIQEVKPQNLHRRSMEEVLQKGYSPCRECKPL